MTEQAEPYLIVELAPLASDVESRQVDSEAALSSEVVRDGGKFRRRLWGEDRPETFTSVQECVEECRSELASRFGDRSVAIRSDALTPFQLLDLFAWVDADQMTLNGIEFEQGLDGCWRPVDGLWDIDGVEDLVSLVVMGTGWGSPGGSPVMSAGLCGVGSLFQMGGTEEIFDGDDMFVADSVEAAIEHFAEKVLELAGSAAQVSSELPPEVLAPLIGSVCWVNGTLWRDGRPAPDLPPAQLRASVHPNRLLYRGEARYPEAWGRAHLLVFEEPIDLSDARGTAEEFAVVLPPQADADLMDLLYADFFSTGVEGSAERPAAVLVVSDGTRWRGVYLAGAEGRARALAAAFGGLLLAFADDRAGVSDSAGNATRWWRIKSLTPKDEPAELSDFPRLGG